MAAAWLSEATSPARACRQPTRVTTHVMTLSAFSGQARTLRPEGLGPQAARCPRIGANEAATKPEHSCGEAPGAPKPPVPKPPVPEAACPRSRPPLGAGPCRGKPVFLRRLRFCRRSGCDGDTPSLCPPTPGPAWTAAGDRPVLGLGSGDEQGRPECHRSHRPPAPPGGSRAPSRTVPSPGRRPPSDPGCFKQVS